MAKEIDATDGALEVAAENDVDLSKVKGTGDGGRIVKSDVEAFLEAQPAPKKSKAKAGPPDPNLAAIENAASLQALLVLDLPDRTLYLEPLHARALELLTPKKK